MDTINDFSTPLLDEHESIEESLDPFAIQPESCEAAKWAQDTDMQAEEEARVS